jgi:hypothetical protein
MAAYLLRLSGLRQTIERCGHFLHTGNFSTLSHALRRATTLRFVRALVQTLAPSRQMRQEELVAVDSMAITLPKTQRHRCKKFNNRTVGGGVMWAFRIRARRWEFPVTVLKTMRGAWCDAYQVRDVALVPRGPVYLMDRGFFALATIVGWLGAEVRFILRVRTKRLTWHVVRHLSPPRMIGGKRLELDALVVLGGARAKVHPRVRLVIARLPGGEKLALVTDLLEWSAERVLASYRKRWHIERFHRFLKDTLGLAHLYTFDESGIETLLYTALLLTMLILFASPTRSNAETIDLLWHAFRILQRQIGVSTPWRRNSCIRPRNTKKKTQKGPPNR